MVKQKIQVAENLFVSSCMNKIVFVVL